MTARRRHKTVCAVVAAMALGVSLLLTTPATAQSPRTLWLSPYGSDGASGLTEAEAWRTFSHAFRQLLPGDTLLVKGNVATPYRESVGDYRDQSDPTRIASYVAATPSAPIRVAAAPGHTPWLEGLLWVRGADYWTFDGINVRWPNWATFNSRNYDQMLVKFMDGRGWQFRNAEIKGARGYAGFYVGNGPRPGPADWRISDSCIHHTYGTWRHPMGRDHNIYVATGLGNRGGVIENNLIFAARRGFNIKVGVGNDVSNGSEHLDIRFNTLYRAVSNVLVGFRSNNVTIHRNLAGRVGVRVTGRSDQEKAPSLRGYELTGRNNVASFNYGFGAESLIRNSLRGDWDSRRGIIAVDGNRLRDSPRFNNTSSCSQGFWPANRRLPFGARYGRAR